MAPASPPAGSRQSPARQLVNLKMPIMVLTSEASYHAPYDTAP